MSINDDIFFSENINAINNMVSRILVALIFVPILIVVLSIFELFEVPHQFSLSLFIYILLMSLALKILIKFEKVPKFTMYLGLIGIEFFIALIGTNANAGIYIAYGLVPIISCLYYNKKLSNSICVLSYIFMLISLFIKYKNDADLFGHSAVIKSYLAVAVGYTIEFTFVFIIIKLLTDRTYGTLKHLLSLIDDRNGLIKRLKENSEVITLMNDELETKNGELEKTNSEYQKKNIELEQRNKAYEEKEEELHNTQDRIINFVASSLKCHDLLTGFHVEHTKKYVDLISKKLREQGKYTDILTDETIKLYSDAAFLHDLGKLHTAESILNKPGKLVFEEFEVMKKHPEDGAKLIETLPIIGNGDFNKIARDIALYHHEKWDGTGYPKHISGDKIPLCARIMTAADVLDALISLRTYKEPMPLDKAMRIFEDSSGKQFEPCIVDAVVACKEEIKKIDSDFKKKELNEFKKEVEDKKKLHDIIKAQATEQES